MPPMALLNRAQPNPASFVALETTLLIHGVPRDAALPLARDLEHIVRRQRVHPALIGVVRGIPTVGITISELADMLESGDVPKANASNLGVLIYRASHAATTVSATCELAAQAGLRVFATGAIGGIHRNFASHLDISSDLAALARFPLAVVSSGVKSLLDVPATREALEAIGIPVIGFKTDEFPSFYSRAGGGRVDASFDDVRDLARFVSFELARTGRAVLIANPIPAQDELPAADVARWLESAQGSAAASAGRAATPAILAHLHKVSGGATLKANIALVKSNAALAASLCREIVELDPAASLPMD